MRRVQRCEEVSEAEPSPSTAKDRIAAAIDLTRLAIRLSEERSSEDGRSRAQGLIVAILAGVLGLILTGTLEMQVVEAPSSRMTILLFAALAHATPLWVCARLMKERIGTEAFAAALLGRMLVSQAERLTQVVDEAQRLIGTADDRGLADIDDVSHVLIDSLVTDLERAAHDAAGREQRVPKSARYGSRRHARIIPRHRHVFLTTSDKRSLHANIVNVSQSGVALEGNFPFLEVGASLLVGSRQATVARTWATGIGCQFSEPIPPEQLDANIEL